MISTLDSTLFKLVDIDSIEHIDHLSNMIDISVDEDESFCLADGTISHNSAIGSLLSVRNQDLHGGLPLRGKVKNTWGESATDIIKNKELFEIMTVTGLKFNEECFDYIKQSNDWFTLETESGTMIVNGLDEIFIDGQWVQAMKHFNSQERKSNEETMSHFFS